jgi:hypothetical protein
VRQRKIDASTRRIEEQRAYVRQLEAARAFYTLEMAAGRSSRYGNLGRLLNTAKLYVYVETVKLNRMEEEVREEARHVR